MLLMPTMAGGDRFSLDFLLFLVLILDASGIVSADRSGAGALAGRSSSLLARAGSARFFLFLLRFWAGLTLSGISDEISNTSTIGDGGSNGAPFILLTLALSEPFLEVCLAGILADGLTGILAGCSVEAFAGGLVVAFAGGLVVGVGSFLH